MTSAELNARLESLGIHLVAEGGRLRVNAPRGSLTEELKKAIAGSRDELLELVERRASATAQNLDRIESVQRGARLPLSSFQERMWIRQRMDPTSTDFNIGSIWTSVTQFAADAQSAAVRRLIERHEILHSVFEERAGNIGMRVVPPEAVEIELRDLAAYPALRRAEMVGEAIESEVRRPFDLTSAPAVRFVVCRLGEREAVTQCIANARP